MDITSLTTSQLKQAVDLAAKKEALQSQIDALDQRLNALLGETSAAKLAGGKGGPAKANGAKAITKAKAGGAAKGGAKRGVLKDRIIKEIQGAGEAGVSIKDLAERLKTKPGNLHAWFNSTGKKVEGLKKVGRGTYALS